MTEHPKIHPVVDVEAPAPTAPLVPPGSATSEKVAQDSSVCRNEPFLWFTQGRQRRGAVVAIGATVGILYLVFRPKLPKYSIDSLRISDLRLNFDMTLYAKFDVKITANNPNKKIGIYYKQGGRLSVWYTKSKLCEGSLPKFYQGHQNITKLDVALTGQTESGSTLMSALQEQQQTGQIPLDLKVDAPVAIKLGKLKMRKVRTLGECKLVVDSLSANNIISIKASNCKFRLKL
ncbi:hypothetical protein DITRI_Ditri20bG0088900 [Diplodiscus trichospermus]